MKIHRVPARNGDDIQYWYDRSTRCWWTARFTVEGNQTGGSLTAYTRREIKRIADELANEEG